jgi:hypothetical protein
MIDREEFEAWRAHPVTAALLEKCERVRYELERSWLKTSWFTDITRLEKVDIPKLAYLRGKSDALKSLAKISHADLFKDDNDEHTARDLHQPRISQGRHKPG